MSAIIDFPTYLTPPRVSEANAVVLTRRLINAAPDDIQPNEKKALRFMREGAVEIQSIATQRDKARPENLSDEDVSFDGSWGLFQDQVTGWLRVPGTPKYAIAQRLKSLLFPNGITFVSYSYEDEWFESAKRLRLIDEEGLEASITQLVHADVLPLLRRAHDAMGEGLGVGSTRVTPPDSRAMLTAVRKVAQQIASYARVLSAAVDLDDPESVKRFRSAMEPLDRHRSAYPSPSRKGGAAGGGSTGGGPSAGGTGGEPSSGDPVDPALVDTPPTDPRTGPTPAEPDVPEPGPVLDPGEPGPDEPLPPVE